MLLLSLLKSIALEATALATATALGSTVTTTIIGGSCVLNDCCTKRHNSVIMTGHYN